MSIRLPIRLPTTSSIWVVLTLSVPSVDSLAEDTQADLDTVKSQISSVSGQLDDAVSSRAAIEEHLARNEIRIGALVKQMSGIESRLAEHQIVVAALRAERSMTQSALVHDREELMGQIKASYSVGRQDYLKLLLNQEDPASISRGLTYHAIMQRHRRAALRALYEEVQRITREERVVDHKIANLDQLQEEKSATQDALKTSRDKRESLLASLGLEIERTAAELERLRLDEEKLEKLLSGLKEDLTDIPETSGESESFVNLKGALPWPARGQMLHKFGTERGANGLSWQGVLIGAEQGKPVHSISHGRVAFAGPLKGFGLLMIVDHGDGYMSLYGRNERLLKEVGDWVRTGEPVANVGQGAGDERPGLYFEIRHNGEPYNPVKWCRGASPAAADTLVSG